jgi:secernin
MASLFSTEDSCRAERPAAGCDTWVALPDATEGGVVIFGKNSDRPVFDCQPLLFRPRKRWPSGARLKLEHREIPQVEVTYATLGSSPYWCWGYEQGINEYGVVIGNEAIFTKTFKEAAETHKTGKGPKLGLLGMDLLRLGLERGKTAREALSVITSLLEKYGQFGSGIPLLDHARGGYDNSYLMADSKEAWILESAGIHWVARRITRGTDAISNEPSIRTKWDIASSDLVDYAIKKGWWPEDKRESFDFARAYINEERALQLTHIRAMRVRQLLEEQEGHITLSWMMRIARDHFETTFLKGPYFDAALPDFQTIDMYVSPARFTWGNTASACIAILPGSPDELPVFWWCATPPGNSCYVPFFVHGSKLPPTVSRAGAFGKKVVAPDKAEEDSFSSKSYWWLLRDLLDRTKGAPIGSKVGYWDTRNPIVRAKFDALEKGFQAEVPNVLKEAVKLRKGNQEAEAAKILDAYTQECVDRVAREASSLREQFE